MQAQENKPRKSEDDLITAILNMKPTAEMPKSTKDKTKPKPPKKK